MVTHRKEKKIKLEKNSIRKQFHIKLTILTIVSTVVHLNDIENETQKSKKPTKFFPHINYPRDRVNGCTQDIQKNLDKTFFFERWFSLKNILKMVSILVHMKGTENKTKVLKTTFSYKRTIFTKN